MRLGILADIHEAVGPLREALAVLERERVDRVVFLGDVVQTGKHLEETVALLAAARPVGVWGNHDWGLCGEVIPKIRDRYSPGLFAFMQSLQPRLEVEGCLFSHIEHCLDPTSIDDLWRHDDLLTPDRARRCLAAAPQPRLFMGHHHRWFAATPAGPLAWDGEGPLRLGPGERYFIIVHALFYGHFAVFDTGRQELTPFRVEPAEGYC